MPDDGAQLAAVDAAVGIQNGWAELAQDAIIGFCARQHHLMTQLVGLNEVAAEIGESAADEGFAAGQAARQSYSQHRPTRSIDVVRPVPRCSPSTSRWSTARRHPVPACTRSPVP